VLLNGALRNALRTTHSTLLSPFDPLVWDHERALATWHFDYRIECYTPEAKRKYGYFTLPMLVIGSLLGRIDAKAHRHHKVFELKSIHFESMRQLNWVIDDDAAFDSWVNSLVDAARWHGAKKIVIGRIQAPGTDKKSERMLRSKLLPALSRMLSDASESGESGKAMVPWT
jgi:uncharacterized protein